MKTMKTVQVVMLPFKEPIHKGCLMTANVDSYKPNGNIWIEKGHLGICVFPDNPGSWTKQNLYFINNDNIKEGDWFYDKVLNIVCQTDNTTDFVYANQTDVVVKVICSSDTTLNLPIIPDSFVKAYADSNGTITKIQIEMDKYPVDMYGNEIIYVSKGIQDITAVHSDANCSNDKEYIASYHKERIKLRSDGTVIVQSVKSYSKEDVVRLVNTECKGILEYAYEDENSTEEEPKSLYKCNICGNEVINPSKSILSNVRYCGKTISYNIINDTPICNGYL